MRIYIILALSILPNMVFAQELSIKFQNNLDSLFEVHGDAVGVLIHVESPQNEMSWTSAIGYADKESKEELDQDQPILIASNTKPYVAATILRLVELDKIQLDSPIKKLLKRKVCKKLIKDGYNLDEITVRHLLSHTSGIADYVDDEYFDFVNNNPMYQWKKEAQIDRSINISNPLFPAGSDFKYGDINYLLLTDIIEKQTHKPFYTSIRVLLKFEELNLNNTWFKGLEPDPVGVKPLAHQYADKYNWDSYEINPSWDLYGGGGLATTVKDAALFMQYLFEGKIIKDKSILDEMTSYVLSKDKSKYCLGINNFTFPTFSAYYHGGWWGTDVAYSPETNSSVAVFTLQKSKRGEFAKLSIDIMKSLAKENISKVDTIITEDYELYKNNKADVTLILFPGGASTANEIKEEFDILKPALDNNINVLMMNFNRHLWIDEEKETLLTQKIESIFLENELSSEKIFIGGMSIGGNVALTLSNHLCDENSKVKPEGVFIIDSPIDLYGLYESSVYDTGNPELSDERLEEPRGIINYFQANFGKDQDLLLNIQEVSPFTLKTEHINVDRLKECKLRFYTEPDEHWWKENRQTEYEYTNAYVIQQISKLLYEKEWKNFELIETKGKGYRSDGQRHPHSWSIVNIDELIKWIKK